MRTEKEMRIVMKEWKASGLSQREFGERKGLSYASMHYWRRRLKALDSGSAGESAELPRFAQVHVRGDSQGAVQPMRLQVGENLTLSIPPNFDGEELQRIVGVLRAC